MKKFFSSTAGIGLIIIVVAGALIFLGVSLFRAGETSAIQQELDEVNNQLEQTSVGRNSSGHLRLLAKKKALENLLQQKS